MPANFLHRKRMVIIEFFFLIAAPLILMQVFPQLLILRTAAMGLGIVYILLLSRQYKFNRHSFGVDQLGRTKPLTDLFPILLLCTLLLFLVAEFRRSMLLLPAIQNSSLDLSVPMSIALYSIISVPLQELIFRSFYISRLEVVTERKWVIILISSCIFALVHIPFQNLFIVIACFFLGVLLAHHYLKHRSLASMILAHAWLGSLLVIFNTYTINWLPAL
jgi:membrane protease YdiL (CAAX protease family)